MISVPKSLRNKPSLMTPNIMDGTLVSGRGGRRDSVRTVTTQMECEMHNETKNILTQLSLLYLAAYLSEERSAGA